MRAAAGWVRRGGSKPERRIYKVTWVKASHILRGHIFSSLMWFTGLTSSMEAFERDRANESRHVVLSVVSSHLHTVMMSGASVTHPAPVQMLCCSQVWCAGLPSAPSRDQLLGHFSTTKCCSFKYVFNQDNCSDSNQRPQSSEIQGSIKPSEPHQHVTWCLFFPCLVLWFSYLRFYSIYVSM